MFIFKKLIGSVIVICMLVVPMTMTVCASSINTSYSFKVAVIGKTRSYSAGDINLVLKSSEQLNGCVSGLTKFSVKLYRDNLFFDTYIGEFKAKRNGRTKNGWTNMAEGKYYIYLSKADDGAKITGSMKISQ